jgi:hypothetical protein
MCAAALLILGTGLQEVGADHMWVVQHQKINGVDVGAGVVVWQRRFDPLII